MFVCMLLYDWSPDIKLYLSNRIDWYSCIIELNLARVQLCYGVPNMSALSQILNRAGIGGTFVFLGTQEIW